MLKMVKFTYVLHLVWLACVPVLADTENSDECPVPSLGRCTCKAFADKLHIECIDASLMSVPRDIPENTKTIYIRNDRIETLERDTFLQLPNLELLEIPLVRLTAVQVGAFNGLTALVDLKLDQNYLTNLETGTFDGLINLMWLGLNHNKINSLPMSIFRDLQKLKFLHLEGNMLTELEAGAFDGLVNLTQLMISHNQFIEVPVKGLRSIPGDTLQVLNLGDNMIKALPANIFNIENLKNVHSLLLQGNGISSSGIDKSSFRGLSLHNLDLSNNSIEGLNESAFRDVFLPTVGDRVPTLNLESNPLLCDCKTRGFWDWWKTTDVVVSGSCAQPTFLRDKPIANLTSADFRCRQDLILPPDDVVIELGASDTVCCSAIRYEDDDLMVTWFGPHHDTMETRDRCIQVNMTSESDEGLYTCVALTTDSYDEANIAVTAPRRTTRAPPPPTSAVIPTDPLVTGADSVTTSFTSNTSNTNFTTEIGVPIEGEDSTVTAVVVCFCVIFVGAIVCAVVFIGCRNRRKRKKTKGDVRSTSVTWTSMQSDVVKMQGVPKSKAPNTKYEKLTSAEGV
ncbi:chondroadherin-like [Ptychodera flava]|uniref:chondroadherin-like n=1 Tax=Ptychodera flava TaxID=63121 RepID=UPI00396A04D7